MTTAPAPDAEAVARAVGAVTDPEIRRPLDDLDMVRSVRVEGDTAHVEIALTIVGCPAADRIEREVRAAAASVAGIDEVDLAIGVMSPAERAALTERLRGGKARAMPFGPDSLTRVIAVTSGKGGVGKSTVAVNLAAALAARGLSVGVLDADVYGPSLPTMLGLSGQPDYVDGAIVPHVAHGLKAMSVGLLTKADDAMIWRGPMASQAITQMLTQTRWGTEDAPLDVLVVDLPPGTGDVQLTLIQKTPLDGAVIVSTPQEVALADARRAHTLFQRVNVTTLGLIENMSGPVFGQGGAEAEAGRLGVAFLGDLPLDAALRQAGDAGQPLVSAEPEGEVAQRFAAVAVRVAESLDL